MNSKSNFPAVRAESVFLVSGGARGITAHCVVKLTERYHCSFVLLGRSALSDSEPVWAAGCEDAAALKQAAFRELAADGAKPKPAQVQREVDHVLAMREIRGTLAAVTAAGGDADYLCADVTDRAALQAALVPWRERITGILHGAGVLADKRIEKKTPQDFERVYAAKVDGLVNLLACIPMAQLEQLILFSSVAGFYGNVGQADYAVANEILNKTAHRLQREYPGCRVLAIDWGPWDGGMVTPELKHALAERGVEVIPVPAGTTLLADALAAPEVTPQRVVGGPMLFPAARIDSTLRTHRLRRRLTVEQNPFLYDHVIGGAAVLPTVCAVAWMANLSEQLYPGYTFFQSDDYKALKGIVFDETLADEYLLELKELSKSPAELVFEGVISSQSPNGRPRYHYSARLTLVRELPEPPLYAGMDLREIEPVSGASLYDGETLFHGPAFRGVDRVLAVTERGVTLRCKLPAVSADRQGQFPVQFFNPYLIDSHLQSLLIWAKQRYGFGGLPLQIKKSEHFRPAGFDEVTYATMEVRSATEHTLIADVTAHDAEGRIYSRVSGAEITLSARLNELFRQREVDSLRRLCGSGKGQRK